MKHFGCIFLVLSLVLIVKSVYGGFNFYEESVSPGSTGTIGKLVKKDERIPIVSTEFGEISAVDIDDGVGNGRHSYHLQFITLEPNSLFLPVLLHADIIFYVQTGSGKISWTDSDKFNEVSLRRGDVYRLNSGTLFYLHSSLEAERPRLKIIAIFANPDEDQLQGPSMGPYSSINDLVRGFDKRVLQAAFQVPEEVVEELTSAIDTPAIVHAEPKKKNFWEKQLRFINAFLGIQGYNKQVAENKKKNKKTFNFFKEDPDFENCNGWSTIVTHRNLEALHDSQIGVFMVNLTKGSIMGPHWNPMATEVSVVLEGEGMVRVVCPSALMNKDCKNSRFRIEEGDVFTVPRFHPMAQTSFNNGSLVFMGFTTTSKKNHPQFIAGKASVLQTISKPILSASFNVSNTTIDQMLAAQEKAVILDCTSCAEEQELLMEDEIEKERQEEEERRQEEEARRKEEKEQRRREEEEKRKEEEEERRKQEQEEEQRQREEEEQRRREEEEQKQKRQEEEERKQKQQEEEEERRRQEKEMQREEEEQRRREEEQRRREEEEQRRREEEQEQKQKRQEEERRRQEKEMQREEEEQRRREEEQRRREEEEQRRREEEQEQKQKRQEEERRREEKERQREEEEQRSQEEMERQREEEEQRSQEEMERQREEEEERRQEKERREQQRRQEEERQRQEEEERRRKERQEEEERRRKEEEGRGEEEESEQEIARREEKERKEWQKQAEEAARKRQEQGESGGDRREGGRRFLRLTA